MRLGCDTVNPPFSKIWGMTDDYNVVMVTPMSIRFPHGPRWPSSSRPRPEPGHRVVVDPGRGAHRGGAAHRHHPLIVFREGATGRRAALVGGPEVWEVIAADWWAATCGWGAGPARAGPSRSSRADPRQVEAALDYYADFTAEIDAEIDANLAATDEAEASWRRRQGLLAR